MKITFDSNVWESFFDPSKQNIDNFVNLKQLIKLNKIEPYICEVALSLESIRKKQRALVWENYKPLFEFEVTGTTQNEDGSTTFHNSLCISPDTKKHPGLHSVLVDRLELAKNLGFKVLSMTNFGTIRTSEIPEEMKVSFVNKTSMKFIKIGYHVAQHILLV